MSINNLFTISQKGLAAYQRALNVTANNISNASNPDYSRQRVNIQTDPSVIRNGFEWGSGVNADQVLRIRNSYVEKSILENNSSYEYYDTKANILQQVESFFGEPGTTGISASVTEFLNSWQKLSVTPNSSALRNDVLNTAEKLASRVNQVNSDLEYASSKVGAEFQEQLEILNSKLEQITKINKQITQTYSNGAPSNQLLDERDKVIEEISALTDVRVDFGELGTANVYINGLLAADVNGYEKLEFNSDGTNVFAEIPDTGEKATFNGGKLGALSEIYSEDLKEIKEQFDNFTKMFAEKVNGLHTTGTTITDPPQTGLNFFSFNADGDLQLSADVKGKPNAIAVSGDGTGGNADIATAIAAIADDVTSDGSPLLAYNNLIGMIGSETQASVNNSDSTNLVLEHMKDYRLSESGVSLDEEMGNMIKYQRSYEASARIARIADQMFETLLGII